MKNTGKRTITILLTLVMTITILFGNGIEARAVEHSSHEILENVTVRVGDVIRNTSYISFQIRFIDGNDKNHYVNVEIRGEKNTHTVQKSYDDGNGGMVRTNTTWTCITKYPGYDISLVGEQYDPQTEEKKPESTPRKEVEAQPIVADQPEIVVAPEEVHLCNMEWVTTKEPSVGEDGEECYRCSSCGRTEQKMPIPGAVAHVKDFCGFIKDAAQNGLVTYDAKTNTAISDYIIQKMAERRDVTTVISFEYKGEKYQITFSPEADYDALLNDEEQFYGYLGLSGHEGITVEKVNPQS